MKIIFRNFLTNYKNRFLSKNIIWPWLWIIVENKCEVSVNQCFIEFIPFYQSLPIQYWYLMPIVCLLLLNVTRGQKGVRVGAVISIIIAAPMLLPLYIKTSLKYQCQKYYICRDVYILFQICVHIQACRVVL